MLRRLLGCCGSSSTQTRARRAARRGGVLAERDDQAGAGAARRTEARLVRRIAEIEAETEELLWTLMEQMETEEAAGADDDDTETERLIAALPSFTTASPVAALAKNNTADDCAVCLEPLFNAETDLLRLLPACRHAFHAACIDAWLRTSLSCPFCRCAVSFPLPPLPDVVAAAGGQAQEPFGTRAKSSRRRSFSVDLGGVTDRRSFDGFDERCTYSIGGSFDYHVDEEVEAIVSRIVRPEAAAPGEAVEDAVGSRGWLGEFLDSVAGAASAIPFPGSGAGG